MSTQEHRLTIINEATGDSACSCGMWTYEVRNFRPMWPMDKADVRRQVENAFATHVRFVKTGRVSEEAA